jgi:hypothetical protein
MPVSYTSPEAKTLELLENLVVNSATFRSCVGAADVAAAKGKLVSLWGGREKDTAGEGKAVALDGTTLTLPCAHGELKHGEFPADESAWRTHQRHGNAMLLVYHARTADHKPAEVVRDALNKAGAIATEMRNLLGSASTYPAGGEVYLAGPPEIPDLSEGAAWSSYVRSLINIAWRGV